MASSPQRLFLDPAVVARLGSLELKARTIVEGFPSGLHRSPFKGFSVEFAEYRQYMPGDDLSTIDWKVYARSDRPYVKKFEEETNLYCHVLLDVSGSMAYGSTGITKHQYAACLAASLGYLMTRQRDAVGLAAFDEKIVARLPARARPGHLHALLVTLDQLAPGRETQMAGPLHAIADSMTRRGMVVLISDLIDEPASVIKGLKHLRYRGTDVVVFHLLDPDGHQARADQQVCTGHDQERHRRTQPGRHQRERSRDAEQDDRQQGEERCGREHPGTDPDGLRTALELGLGELDLTADQRGQVAAGIGHELADGRLAAVPPDRHWPSFRRGPLLRDYRQRPVSRLLRRG